MQEISIYLLVINIIAFLLYAIDKWKAKHKRWRIPEFWLLLVAFIGGSAGALLGMTLLRHKTNHSKFYILVPIFLFLHIILICAAVH